MGKAVPSQHPAVVLRSRYTLARALLAIAMIAVVGLTAAVVILANDGEQVTGTTTARPIDPIDYGGFNPATGRPESAPRAPREAQASAGPPRYDGGPEEGTRGPLKDYSKNAASGDYAPAPTHAPTTRYDGGPDEGTRGPRLGTD